MTIRMLRVVTPLLVVAALVTPVHAGLSGACCLSDLTVASVPCTDVNSESDCLSLGGFFLRDQMCSTAPCTGACCFEMSLAGGGCSILTDEDCNLQDGIFNGIGTTCEDDACDLGACCLPPLVIIVTPVPNVAGFNGVPECFGTSRFDCEQTGGVFFNGDSCDDPDVDCTPAERAHPGWNHVSTEITLTKDQPTYWSAYSGQPQGVAPFTVLDPGDPPGRPADDGTLDRVLRGYIVAWAVNSVNQEIRWNHLKGDALLVNYRDPSAWEYNAWAFRALNVDHGEQTGDPGVLNMDGVEYALAFDQLLLDFYASGSSPFMSASWSGDMAMAIPFVPIETDLTLHPVSVDLRQEDDGPVTTKAKIDVWNENEVKFNGLERCITCWDQTLLSRYAEFGIPNNFIYETLQTNKGKARIDGVQSDNCDFDFEFDPLVPFGADPRDIVSQDAALLGLSAKQISLFNPLSYAVSEPTVAGPIDDGPIILLPLSKQARSGRNLIGLGTQAAVLRYDTLDAPPEAAGPANAGLGRGIARNGRRIGAAEGVAASQDRVSGTEKGSLLIFSKVELRWDFFGDLIQDTFIDMSNDFGEDVTVQMYFINGDAPLEAVDGIIFPLPAFPF